MVETLTIEEACAELEELAIIHLVKEHPLMADEDRKLRALRAYLEIMRGSANLTQRDLVVRILHSTGEILRRGKLSDCGCPSCEAKAREDL